MTKPGRNDPCPCGSGKKYKKCCQAVVPAPVSSLMWQRIRATEGKLIGKLVEYAETCYGPNALEDAWSDFTLWREFDLDEDEGRLLADETGQPDMQQVPNQEIEDPPDGIRDGMDDQEQREFEAFFLPWFVFNWIPDGEDFEPEDFELGEERPDYPDMPVAIHYLQHKGTRLDDFERRFIFEACNEHFSFFSVTGVEAGKHLDLRDLLIERSVRVLERQASMMLAPGTILFARVMTLEGVSIMLGSAPLMIPPRCIDQVIAMREHITRFDRDPSLYTLFDFAEEVRELYFDIRDELFDPAPPQLQNTDGDDLEPTTLHFTLQCTPQVAFDALASLALSYDSSELLDAGERDANGDLVAVGFPWLRAGNPLHAGWQNTALGELSINRDRLEITVNSRERAASIRAEVTRRLGVQAAFRNAVIQSIQHMMEEIAAGGGQGRNSALERETDELNARPEVQEAIRAMARAHWETWPDIALPALRGETPREAASTARGRELLESLLWDIESHAAGEPFAPDVPALRRELGMD